MFVYWLYDDENWNIYKQGYVGITKRFRIRIYQHVNKYKRKFNYHKVIYSGSEAECLALELLLRSDVDIGWNLAKGGFKGYRNGHSKSSIEKLKIARAKQPSFALGIKHSKDTCERRRLANTGKKRTPEVCEKMRLLRINISDETRLKMSKSATNRKHTEETKLKVIKALTGRVVTQETRNKIAETLRNKNPIIIKRVIELEGRK